MAIQARLDAPHGSVGERDALLVDALDELYDGMQT